MVMALNLHKGSEYLNLLQIPVVRVTYPQFASHDGGLTEVRLLHKENGLPMQRHPLAKRGRDTHCFLSGVEDQLGGRKETRSP